MSGAVPGWQTEELQDEWPDSEPEEVEEDHHEDGHNLSYGTQSVSLTIPLNTQIHSTADFQPEQTGFSEKSYAVGTFLVRDDVADVPIFPKTPGRNKKKLAKDFFTPSALETMFEPPSPPQHAPPETKFHNSSPLSRLAHSPGLPPSQEMEEEEEEEDEIVETDMPNMNSFHGRKASMACQFTFAVPRDPSSQPNGLSSAGFPQAQSTPNPPFASKTTAPATDPRLRLFQFQYDTYTRDHLSALVDSIAINTPSGGTGTTTSTPISFGNGLSPVSEVSGSALNTSHMRSSKRVKLSPSADFYGEGAGLKATISRPKLYGKDYVGESRSLMQQIKLARDYSTISTVASGQNDSPSISHHESHEKSRSVKHKTASPNASVRRPTSLSVPQQTSSNASSSGSINSKVATYSASTYRQKAAALMEQIKSDVKRQKRVFSGDSEMSHVTTQVDDSTTTSVTGSVKINAEGKENSRHSTHRRTASSSKSNTSRSTRPSPRKSSKRLADESDLVHNLSRISIQEPIVNVTLIPPPPPPTLPGGTGQEPQSRSTLAPPSYPSIRLNGNEDLNRFVSSSTASGTTITAGSAPSFVKHAGPAHIRTIAPTDLPSMPERLGDMLFDKVMMKWVKSTARAIDRSASHSLAEVSDDPFGDIESLRDDSSTTEQLQQEASRGEEEEDMGVSPLVEMSRIEEHSEVEDEEELELSNFSTDASAHIVHVMTGVETDGYDDDDETTDSESDNDDLHTATQAVINDIDFDSEFEDSPSRNMSALDIGQSSNAVPGPSAQQSSPARYLNPHTGTPNRGNSVSASGTPTIKSALKSNSATPTSALKYGSRSSRFQTPLHRKTHRRSVSFSDGKRDGPMRDILVASGGQSVRTKRIADMMNALEDSDLDEGDSPSKASSSGRPEELQPLHARRPSNAPVGGESPRRVFSRSYSQRQSPGRGNSKANGTFLTECSFGVAHDRLVEVITDVQPFEPHWEQLSSIDLSGAKLESVARLKEFLPRLDALSLNQNDLAWLSGIPGSVRTLSVAFNCLSGITSYSHLHNLENLDISHNEVDSLRQLECLRHLRELKADSNKITSLDGLQRMDGLVKLSLQGNKIQAVDLAQYRWSRLEMLNISHNRIDGIHGLSSLQSLIALNIDTNSVDELLVSATMSRLRILRVSGNRLRNLDVGTMPNLRTLYADNNSLTGVAGVHRLTKLENLSLRNQSGRGLNLLTRDVRDVKRLYLSGNPLKSDFLKEPCYNLVYLEMAACRLTALPEGMSKLLPNLRVLNLNYNFLEDVRPLGGLTRLQKLTIIGSRLKSTKPLIRLLQEMPDAEMLDFRMNPCTLGWYLPLLVKDVPGALQPSEGGGSRGRDGKSGEKGWQDLDSKFRRDLPDEAYIGRLAYRGLIMRGCGRLRLLDGVGVSEKERTKADDLLAGIMRGK